MTGLKAGDFPNGMVIARVDSGGPCRKEGGWDFYGVDEEVALQIAHLVLARPPAQVDLPWGDGCRDCARATPSSTLPARQMSASSYPCAKDIDRLNEATLALGFRDDVKKAQQVTRQRSNLGQKVEDAEKLTRELDDAKELLELGASEKDDSVVQTRSATSMPSSTASSTASSRRTSSQRPATR